MNADNALEPLAPKQEPRSEAARLALYYLLPLGCVFVVSLLAALIVPRPFFMTIARDRNEISKLSPTVERLWFEGISDADLEALPELTEVRRVVFRDCPNLHGSGLKHLTKILKLRAVEIEGCPNLEDSALAAFHSVKTLQSLDIQGPTKLSDAGLVGLARCEGLLEVTIAASRGVSLAALKDLHRRRPGCTVSGPYGSVASPDSDAEHARHQAEKNRSNVPANR